MLQETSNPDPGDTDDEMLECHRPVQLRQTLTLTLKKVTVMMRMVACNYNCFKMDLLKNPKKEDFVVIEFQPGIFYVAQVLAEEDKDGDIEVSFLRKSLKLADSFVYPQVEDTDFLANSLVRAVLPAPMVGQIKRLNNCFKFPADFKKN